MKNGMLKRILAGLMVASMMLLSVDAGCITALAADLQSAGTKTQVQNQSQIPENPDKLPSQMGATGYIDLGITAPSIKEEQEDVSGGIHLDQATTLPAQYDSREKGYVTAIKNQNPFGSCWAFAACAAMESYALSHGLVNSPEDIDLSEYALVYYTFMDDLYKDMTGDETILKTEGIYAFDAGGNDEYVLKTLSKWAGIYTDDDVSYDSLEKNSTNLPVPNDEDIRFRLSGQYYININDTAQIKNAVINNGAVTVSYYASASYAADGRQIYNYNYEYSGTNHAVTIVGWDDNKDKNLFTVNGHTPQNNGAWLVKNSWGTSYGENGYIWISYEDKGLLSSDAVVYEIVPDEVYDNVYQHDGATLFWAGLPFDKFAATYEITGASEQYIQAVSFAIRDGVNAKYQIDIYKHTEGHELNNGELVATKRGATTHIGYYTATLDTPVSVASGEVYTIVISFDKDVSILIGMDEAEMEGVDPNNSNNLILISTTESSSQTGQNYLVYDGYFMDFHNEYYENYSNICIKMFTSDAEDAVRVPQISGIEMTGKDEVTISWQEINGALSYELWIGSSANDANAVIITSDTNSYVMKDAQIGKTYYYKVRAIYADDVTSDYSILKSYLAKLPQIILSGWYMDFYGVKLSWNKLSFADGYRVYRAGIGGEFELLTEITDRDTLTYLDTQLEMGQKYTYYVLAYVEDVISEKGNEVSLEIPFCAPMDVEVNQHYYGKLILHWNMPAENIGGYEILVYQNGEELPLIELEASAKSYTLDTSAYNINDMVDFMIRAYVVRADGIKVYSEYETAWASISKSLPALDVNVKWYVDKNGYIILMLQETTQEMLKIVESENLDDYSKYYNAVLDENGSVEGRFIYIKDTPYEIYIMDEELNAGIQELPYKVGGAFMAPILEKVENSNLESAGQKVLLKAVITNAMENFYYKYQWYVSDTVDGTATAIEGATEPTYEATVGSTERKYFFCTVSCEYDGTKTYTTTNTDGGRTAITGENYEASILVDAIADQTYTGEELTPNLIVRDAQTNELLVKGTDYTVTYRDNIVVGKAGVVITYIGLYAHNDADIIYFNIMPAKAEKLTASNVENVTYSGSEWKPSFTVSYGEIELVPGTDYDAEYKDNTNAGTASIVITLKGNYEGTITKTFEILPKSLDPESLIVTGKDGAAIDEFTYTGSPIVPELIITSGQLSSEGEDADFGYRFVFIPKENEDSPDYTNVGTVTYKLILTGNYSAELTLSFTIVAVDAGKLLVPSVEAQEYTGKEIRPELNIKYGNILLVEGVDYDAVYKNNIECGQASAVITFKGNYTGSITKIFDIVPHNIAANDILVSGKDGADINSFTYTGLAIVPELVITSGELSSEGEHAEITYRIEFLPLPGETETDNINAGLVRYKLILTGNYTGEVVKTFVIKPLSAEGLTVTDVVDRVYTGASISPEVEVSNGSLKLIKGEDYDVAYNSNVNAGTASIIISLKGNYTGRITKEFKILPAEIATKDLKVTGKDGAQIDAFIYTGSPVVPEVVISSGNLSSAGENPALSYKIVFVPKDGENEVDNINVGEVTYKVVLTGNYTGEITLTYTIVPADADELTIPEISEQKYTGEAVCPELNITYGDMELEEGIDYEAEYTDNIEVGTAAVKITFKGNYTGEKTITFVIVNLIPDVITSEDVAVDDEKGYISKITAGLTVEELLKGIKEAEYVKVVNKDNEEVATDALLGTGMKVCIMDEDEVVKEYVVIVSGDTNGDGKISITDMIAVKSHLLKKEVLTDVYEKAADVAGATDGGDGKVSITDFIKVKAHLLKKEIITGVAVK